MATMKKQLLALAMALLVLLSVTAMASTGRYDQQIQQAVSHKIRDAKHLENVNSSVEDGIVILTGTVDLYQNKLDAAKKAKKVANVTGVRRRNRAGCSTPEETHKAVSL
jgi:ABC-type oligopeptide transport system substrate-binding subunit